MIQLSKHFQRILNASKEIASLNGKWLFSKRNRPVIGPSVNLRDKNEFTPSYALYPYGAGLTFKLISKFSKEDSNSRSKTTTKQEDMKETAKGQQQKPIINNNVQTLKNESQLLKDEKQNTNYNPSKTTMKQKVKKVAAKGQSYQKNIQYQNKQDRIIQLLQEIESKQKFYQNFLNKILWLLERMPWKFIFGILSIVFSFLFAEYMKFTHVFQDRKKGFQKEQMINKYGIDSVKINAKGVFNDYLVYKKIDQVYTKMVNKEQDILQVYLITGPSGVGKTTCIKDQIKNKLKNDGKRQTVVFYLNLKAQGTQNKEKPQVNYDALSDLKSILGRVLKRQSESQTVNNVLILDEINVICKEQFRRQLYFIRGMIQNKVKVIALSSCSDASDYLESVIGGFVQRHDLKPLKKQDVKKFLSLKLQKYELGDKVLDSIACKFTAIRKLQNLIINFKPKHFSEEPIEPGPNNPGKAEQQKSLLNEEAIRHFNPLSNQVEKLQLKIARVSAKVSNSQTFNKNLVDIIMVDRAIFILENSLKDKSDAVIKRFSSQDQNWQTGIQLEFLDDLYSENIIFDRYPKDQNGRLALINWVSKKLENKELQKMSEYQGLKTKWQELRPLCEKLQPNAGLEYVNNESKA